MKIRMTLKFKIIFLLSCVLLYISGVAYYYFEHFVHIQTQFGPGQSPYQALVLHAHGILGLLFIFLFGYLYGTHVVPGLRGILRKPSGYTLLGTVLTLCLTVPGLYYLGDEKLRELIANVHTYIGLAAVLPFVLHYFELRSKKRVASLAYRKLHAPPAFAERACQNVMTSNLNR